MSRILGLITTVATLGALAISVAAYQGALAATPSATAHAAASVAIQGFAFDPVTLKVPVGTTVTWTNKDSVAHTVVSDTGAWPDSSPIDTNKTFSFTFTKPGTYNYHCSIHPSMTAAIVVSASGVAPTGTGQQPSATMMAMGKATMRSLNTWTGYYDGKASTYVVTDTSSKAEAAQDHINYSASLGKTLADSSLIYFATNGTFAGYGAVFGTAPGESDYTPIFQKVLVTWKDPAKAAALTSDNQINSLASKGLVSLNRTGIVLDAPYVFPAH